MADRQNRRISTLGSRITSLVSVALVLVLLGLAGMSAIAGKSLTDEVRRNVGFIVKMQRESTSDQENALKRSLMSDKAIDIVTFSSAADILSQESEYLGPEVIEILDENPYASEFDVRVKPAYASFDSISALTGIYSRFEGVDEIVTESAVIEDVDMSLRRGRNVLLIIAAVMLVICVALINNTVSLSIYSRRFIIHTMKLVGATGAFIRRPFLNAAALNGLMAGALASGIIISVKLYLSSFDPMLAGAVPDIALALVCVLITLAGVAICLITAAFATNRYLRSSYDDMFLK